MRASDFAAPESPGSVSVRIGELAARVVDQAPAARLGELAAGARHRLVSRTWLASARDIESKRHPVVSRDRLERLADELRRRRADADDVQRHLDVGLGAGAVELSRRFERL